MTFESEDKKTLSRALTSYKDFLKKEVEESPSAADFNKLEIEDVDTIAGLLDLDDVGYEFENCTCDDELEEGQEVETPELGARVVALGVVTDGSPPDLDAKDEDEEGWIYAMKGDLGTVVDIDDEDGIKLVTVHFDRTGTDIFVTPEEVMVLP